MSPRSSHFRHLSWDVRRPPPADAAVGGAWPEPEPPAWRDGAIPQIQYVNPQGETELLLGFSGPQGESTARTGVPMGRIRANSAPGQSGPQARTEIAAGAPLNGDSWNMLQVPPNPQHPPYLMPDGAANPRIIRVPSPLIHAIPSPVQTATLGPTLDMPRFDIDHGRLLGGAELGALPLAAAPLLPVDTAGPETLERRLGSGLGAPLFTASMPSDHVGVPDELMRALYGALASRELEARAAAAAARAPEAARPDQAWLQPPSDASLGGADSADETEAEDGPADALLPHSAPLSPSDFDALMVKWETAAHALDGTSAPEPLALVAPELPPSAFVVALQPEDDNLRALVEAVAPPSLTLNRSAQNLLDPAPHSRSVSKSHGKLSSDDGELRVPPASHSPASTLFSETHLAVPSPYGDASGSLAGSLATSGSSLDIRSGSSSRLSLGPSPNSFESLSALLQASSLNPLGFSGAPGRQGAPAGAAVRRNANDTLYQCPQCSKVFRRPYALKSHYRMHSTERPFVCSYPGCDAAFQRKHDQRRHERLHVGAKKFACKICDKRFARADALTRHLRTTDPMQPSPCGVRLLELEPGGILNARMANALSPVAETAVPSHPASSLLREPARSDSPGGSPMALPANLLSKEL